MSSPSYTHMTCGLKVDTQSPGWERTITKVFKKINGVKYSIDEEGNACISGRVDPNKLLTKIAQAGKHVVLCWVEAGNQNPIMMNNNPFNNFNYPNFDNYHLGPAYHLPMSDYYPPREVIGPYGYNNLRYGPYGTYPSWT